MSTNSRIKKGKQINKKFILVAGLSAILITVFFFAAFAMTRTTDQEESIIEIEESGNVKPWTNVFNDEYAGLTLSSPNQMIQIFIEIPGKFGGTFGFFQYADNETAVAKHIGYASASLLYCANGTAKTFYGFRSDGTWSSMLHANGRWWVGGWYTLDQEDVLTMAKIVHQYALDNQ